MASKKPLITQPLFINNEEAIPDDFSLFDVVTYITAKSGLTNIKFNATPIGGVVCGENRQTLYVEFGSKLSFLLSYKRGNLTINIIDQDKRFSKSGHDQKALSYACKNEFSIYCDGNVALGVYLNSLYVLELIDGFPTANFRQATAKYSFSYLENMLVGLEDWSLNWMGWQEDEAKSIEKVEATNPDILDLRELADTELIKLRDSLKKKYTLMKEIVELKQKLKELLDLNKQINLIMYSEV